MLFNISDDYLDEMIANVRVNRTPTAEAEVLDLIQAALNDISRQGVEVIDINDPLIKMLVRYYCRANYGYDSGEARERFQHAYDSLSQAVALDFNYRQGGDVQ